MKTIDNLKHILSRLLIGEKLIVDTKEIPSQLEQGIFKLFGGYDRSFFKHYIISRKDTSIIIFEKVKYSPQEIEDDFNTR